ncbi:uncharacterized protein [Dermacentor andersoni]|uniref:uncharacterized protein n=1 Tax=Dermacentor andersoni TaxID=34620 RepID=UPI002417C919|nr:proteoglycan 4-like [Dermacentor andersoni]XP_054927610.1 proteoglycan 4-like [Dermacentor andersoni]XP_054928779.1 proteoglycan 4-like [Dermacentor andersoni]
MAAKGPRVSKEQAAILVQFIEQHPYLARASTEFSPRMTAARKNELWEEVAAVLNAQGPAVKATSRWRNHWAKMAHKAKKEAARAASEKRATGGGKVGGVDGRVLDVLMRTGGVLVSPPEYFPDSEDEASSEEAAGPSGSRRNLPATTAFVVSGPAAVAGPSGLTQPPATPQVLRPTTQVPQPTPQVPQPTPQVPQPTPQLPQPTPQVPQPTPQVPQPTPQVPQPTPREPRAPRRQPRQQELDGAVMTATAAYVRQSQLEEARVQEDTRFRQQLLEQNRQHHEAHLQSLRQHHEAHMESLRHLGEEVAAMREVESQRLEVQRQRLEVARRSHETNERLLQLLLAALGHGGSQAPPPSQAPHN